VEIIQIVPRLPPAIDGVGDYAYLLAQQLRKGPEIQTRFLVCGAKSDEQPSTPAPLPEDEGSCVDGFSVYRLRERSAAELARVLSRPGMPRTALLQYVGYGYEKRGCPLWLERGLRAWKRGTLTPVPSSGRRGQTTGAKQSSPPAPLPEGEGRRHLVTMFHELYASGPPWRSSFWTSPLQRWAVRCLVRLSDRCFTNRAVSAGRLASMGKHPAGSIRVLPVLSNLGESPCPLPLAARKPQMVLYDNFGRNPRTRSLAASLIRRACERMGIERLVLLGRGDTAEWLTTGLEVECVGVAAPEVASRLLAESRAGCLDYFDGYLGKSGIFAAYSAHALLPLLLFDNHSEADGLQINRHFWAAAALPDETSTRAQQEVATQARRWYDAHGAAAAAQAYAEALTDLAC
jgi:hypothetical protein